MFTNPDSNVHGANMGPTRVLSAPDGPNVGPMDLGIWEGIYNQTQHRAQELLKNDEVVIWKRFLNYWPFVRGIHRLPAIPPQTVRTVKL